MYILDLINYSFGSQNVWGAPMSENFMIPMSDAKSIDFDELMKQDTTLLKILATRPDTPAVVLAHLACSRDKMIRKAVASNPKTPSDILTVLADDGESVVYRAVAENPNAPAAVLKRFIEGGGYATENALKNPNAPLESILYRMLKNMPEGERAAVGLNERFSDLIKIAGKIDRSHQENCGNNGFLSIEDFGSDDDEIKAQWG